MGLTLPYGQNHYMGEYATEGAALTWIRGNKWDSVGDGSGNPKAGMAFFDTAAAKIKVHDGSAWVALGSAAPGGSSGQIQYNNSSAFGGASQLYWDSGNAGLAYGKTTVDGSRIDVVTVEGTYPYQATMHGSNQNYGCFVSLRKARGSQGSETTVADGDPIGGISFRGYGSAYTTVAAIKATVSGTVSGNNIPTKLEFQTHNGTAFDTRMTVTSAGNVFIGTTAGVSVSGTTQTHSLMVYGADSSPQFNGIISEGGNTQGRFNGHRHNGTYGTKTAVATTQNLLGINAFGWDGGTTPTYVSAAAITFTVDGTVAEDSVPGKILFWTREVGNTGSSPFERMVITNIGRVGIANNAPTALLTIGTNATVGGAIDLLGATSGTCAIRVAAAAGTTTFQLPATNGTSGYFLQTNGSGVTTWAAVTASAAGSTGYVQFNNGGALAGDAAFFWDNTNKRLGIGCTDPVNSVEISKDTANASIFISAFSNSTNYGTFYVQRGRGTRASKLAVQSGDRLGQFGFAGYYDTTNNYGCSFVTSYATENWASGARGSDIRFELTAATTTTTVERMRLTSAGNVFIGSTAGYSFNGTVLNYSLQISGADSSPFTVGIVQEAAGTQTRFNGYRCNGSLATKTAVASGDILFANNGSGWDGGTTPTYVPAGFMQIIVDGAVAEDSVPGRIIFNTCPVGSTSGPAERMRISNDGKVSIATTTPSSALLTLGLAGTTAGSISLAGATSGTCTVQVAAAAGTTTFQLPATNGTSGHFLQTNGSGVTTWAAVTAGAAGSTGWVQYNSGGSLAASSGFTFDSTNRVVDLAGDAVNPGLRVTAAGTSAFPFLTLRRYRNTVASPQAVQSGDVIGQIAFVGYGTTGAYSGAQFVGYADGTWTDSSAPAYLLFRTTPSGTTTPVERLRITHDGKLSTGAETAPDVDPGGICINHGANDGFPLTFKNSDVSHPFTAVCEADTYFRVNKTDNAAGGANLIGLGTVAIGIGLLLGGACSTPASGTSEGCVAIVAYKSNGTTGFAALAATENLAAFRSYTTTQVIIKGSGDIHTVAGLKIGAYGQTAAAGAIEWNGTNFRGYTGSVWKNLDLGGTTVDAGTAQGQVIFWDNGGSAWTHTETSEWFWDDTNKRVGIGCTTPTTLLTLGTAGTTAGKITLAGATSGTCVIQVAAAAGTGTIFQLPATNGTNGYFLKTDGSGVTSWAAASSGTTVDAGTAQGQVLFWNATGSAWTYAETSEWVWDDTNKRVGINVAAPSSRLDVGGDVEISSDAWHYYGDPTTDGSWRTGRVSADLVVQKRESGTWNTKHTFV